MSIGSIGASITSEKPRLIVNLGANVGYASAYFLTRFPSCRLIAVEPDPDNFTMLTAAIAPYGERAKAIQGAIWPLNEKLQVHKQGILGREWGRTVSPGPGDVKAITMDDILNLANGKRIDIIKIDIQGAERQLFSHHTRWLDYIDNMVIELHSDECREIFLRATDGRIAQISECFELTCCALKHPAQVRLENCR